MKNYIFDLDGTLIDSREEIISCIKEACIDYIENFSVFNNLEIGMPIKNILELYFEDKNIINSIILKYREIYDNKKNDKTTLFEGVENTLKILKKKNFNLFLLTNKPLVPTNRILEKLKIKKYFNYVYTIDLFSKDIKNKKERLARIIEKHNLKVCETVYIGDTIEDADAAVKNNIMFIASLWGYDKNKELLMSKADFWLSSLNFENIDILIDKLKKIRG